MREVRLGDFLIPALDPEPIRPEVEYQTAGVLSHGKGLFARPMRKGSEISYSTYYRLHADQLVYSRLFAWEGALAVVPHQFDGFFVSQEFPTFDIDFTKALPSYVALLINRAGLWDRLAEVVSGMGGRRKRVHPAALLGVSVPVPPLAEQRRIVDVVAAVDVIGGTGQYARLQAQMVKEALLARLVASRPSSRMVTVRDVCELVARGRAPAYVEAGGHLVLSQKCIRDGAVDISVARRTDSKERPVAEWAWVRAGDTLVNSTGRGTCGRAGFVAEDLRATVDSHVTIVRPDPDRVLPAFLGYALFVRKLELEAFATGSTNQTELSRDSIASLRICLPDRREQVETVRLLSAVDAYMKAVGQVAITNERLRTRLVSQLLSGNHKIASSYDRFLDGAA
jgi:type I restriction enzyme S subunit